jgi:aryl-alcohol dehydrogenase-like predicted oxidoreductase
MDKNKSCRIILGTAQWGLHYGVSNTKGVTSSQQVSRILKKAASVGVNLLDTAPGYGNSESKIGKNAQSPFNVITKIPKIPAYLTINDKVKFINSSVRNSLVNLGSEAVFGLLFHDSDDLIGDENGRLIVELRRLKESGVVKHIGVSIYKGTQIDSLLNLFIPDIVQVPMNIMDQRLIHSGHLRKLKSLGVKIHARSVFLQGLFHIPIDNLPTYFEPIKPMIVDINNEAIEQGLTMNQAALSFVRDQPYVDNTIVGVESETQLNAAIDDFTIDSSFHTACSGSTDESFVNPANWEIYNGC